MQTLHCTDPWKQHDIRSPHASRVHRSHDQHASHIAQNSAPWVLLPAPTSCSLDSCIGFRPVAWTGSALQLQCPTLQTWILAHCPCSTPECLRHSPLYGPHSLSDVRIAPQPSLCALQQCLGSQHDVHFSACTLAINLGIASVPLAITSDVLQYSTSAMRMSGRDTRPPLKKEKVWVTQCCMRNLTASCYTYPGV